MTWKPRHTYYTRVLLEVRCNHFPVNGLWMAEGEGFGFSTRIENTQLIEKPSRLIRSRR